MIVDAHTHIFPPEVVSGRDRYAADDPLFAELYAGPRAKLASAGDLLRSMDAAGIDVSVALGFAWTDAEACRHHNDYLLETAAASGGRIVPCCTLPLAAGGDILEAEARRCTERGARGFGELRPDDLRFDLAGDAGRCLGRLAVELDVALLFHVSEPVGHRYAGKHGLALAAFYDFAVEHPEVKLVGAHWGGGLPFYDLMPEVALALRHLHVDTAASSLLYGPGVYVRGLEAAGAEHVLFGSDFPLLSQARSRRRVEESGLDAEARRLVLGENARRLLVLP